MADPTVRMSGIVLASLMFQHVNSDSDVEGLILGESKFEEQVTISDSQADHIHIEEIYNIQKHIAFNKPNDFYNSVGDVDLDSVKKLLADNKEDQVIGWYRQRRGSEQQMSFREKIVHEQLRTRLSNPHMIFVLLTPGRVTTPGSTHRVEYAAFISRSRHFLNVPLSVNNLGLLEQLGYWKVSAPCSATGYNVTVKKHSSKFFCSNGLLRDVSDMSAMNESLQAELQAACSRVEESERQVEALQAEVTALRRRVRERAGPRGGGASAVGGDAPDQNLLLHRAVSALFSPLYHTHTLTLAGFPVPDGRRCSGQEEDVSMATQRRSDGEDGEDKVSLLLRPRRATPCRKRLRETPPERESRRRKSQS